MLLISTTSVLVRLLVAILEGALVVDGALEGALDGALVGVVDMGGEVVAAAVVGVPGGPLFVQLPVAQ
jgi:hypothetical protein